MSIKAMSWVFEQTELAGNEKLVLLSLADHCNDDGIAYPSVERMALKSSISKRSAQRILNKLDDDGWLTRDVRGHHKTTVYKLVFSRGAKLSPLDQGCQMEPSGVTNDAFRGDIAVSPKPSLTVREPSLSCVFSDEFEQWWKDEYPERDGTHSKAKAKVSYIRYRKKGVTKEMIWEATLNYFNELVEQERISTRFVKQATTFLNDQPWEQ